MQNGCNYILWQDVVTTVLYEAHNLSYSYSKGNLMVFIKNWKYIYKHFVSSKSKMYEQLKIIDHICFKGILKINLTNDLCPSLKYISVNWKPTFKG